MFARDLRLALTVKGLFSTDDVTATTFSICPCWAYDDLEVANGSESNKMSTSRQT